MNGSCLLLNSNPMIKIKQGDIVWASLDPIKGHEQAGLRPVLILQNDLFNEHLNTVLVVPLTTNLRTKDFISTYLLEKGEANLKKESILLVHQLRCIDKSRLQKKVGRINLKELPQIKLRLSLLL